MVPESVICQKMYKPKSTHVLLDILFKIDFSYLRYIITKSTPAPCSIGPILFKFMDLLIKGTYSPGEALTN